MLDTPKISVCIPVYNVEKYLQQCIDSLMNQTMETGIEYIFVNDASPDKCGKILQQNERMYPDKIRVIHHSKNQGLGETRNTAIKVARGDYIGFVDSDDFVAPQMYETLYKNAIQSDADVTYIQYASVSSNEQYDRSRMESEQSFSPIFSWNTRLLGWNNKELTDQGISDILVYPQGGLYCGLWKRSLFVNSGIVFPQEHYEDNFFGSLINCYLKKIFFVQKVCYFYRFNPCSTVHARNKSYQLDRIQIEKALLAEVRKRGLFEKYHAAWEYIYTFRYAYNTSMILISTYDNPPVKVIEQLWKDLDNEFPNWRKNRNYCQIVGTKGKLKYYILKNFPRLFIFLFRCKDYFRNNFRINTN